MSSPFKVVFMGTPDFAVPSLNALKEFGCTVSLVVTQPDKPKGRGRKLTPPPVKTAALANDFSVMQPDSVKTQEFYERIAALTPDLLVVVAFGHVLPENILAVPKLGAINVHASLLPKYRGPAPIQWAIINGDAETGITTMRMDKGLDTGDILKTAKIRISRQDTAATLHDRLALLGADVLLETLKDLRDGSLKSVPQDHSLATDAPLLTKSHGRIDWSQSAGAIERFIRGMTPWPGAYTFREDKRLKIFRAEIRQEHPNARPGQVIAGFPGQLWVAAGDGVLSILEIQGSSGKRLPIEDFLRGFPIPVGTVFT